MIKKIYIQFFLILILIGISLIIFFKYFYKTGFKNDLKLNTEKTTNTNESLIEDLTYLSIDKKGNEYKISAKKEM